MPHPLSERALIRSSAVAIFVMVLGCAWDIWWHTAVGRDSFLEPPHLPVYFSLAYLMAVSMVMAFRSPHREWKWLFPSASLLPVAAGFDQVWHTLYGTEDISSVSVVVSPPHLMLVTGMFLVSVWILALLHRDSNAQAQEFFGSLIFACLLTLGLVYVIPFHPSFGWALLGYGGAGVFAFVFVFLTLCAANWKPTFAGGTLSTLVFLLFYAIAFGTLTVGPGITVQPHERAPIWLFAFACLVPAALLDILGRAHTPRHTAIAGFLFGGILFGFSSAFFQPAFQYGMREAGTAIAACALGGGAAGMVLHFCQRRLHFLR